MVQPKGVGATPRFVALLRAVNVGGANRISMQELRSLFGSLGFCQVSTYIQSGNVLFEARERTAAKLRPPIEEALALRMKNDITVILRTPAQLQRTVKGAPFHGGDRPDAKAFVTFLDRPARPPLPKGTPNKDLEVVGSQAGEVFTIAHPIGGRFGNPNAFLERALCAHATSRNWKVVKALNERAGR